MFSKNTENEPTSNQVMDEKTIPPIFIIFDFHDLRKYQMSEDTVNVYLYSWNIIIVTIQTNRS